MPCIDGAYYGPFLVHCSGCGLVIRSCGDPKEPEQPRERFRLPYSSMTRVRPSYYHVNCETEQVAEYRTDGWSMEDIRRYFQTERTQSPPRKMIRWWERAPPLTPVNTSSSASGSNNSTQ